MGRIAFIGVVLVVIMLLAGFAAMTWVHFMGLAGLGWWLFPLLLVGGFVPATLLSFRFQHPLLRGFIVISAIFLGFMNYGFLAAALCWILAGAARLAGLPVEARALAEALYGAAALATAYGLANAARIRITRVAVSLPNLPVAWRGRTIALVSDVHLGNIRGSAFVRRIVARLGELRPDAVFISGDMFDGTQLDIDAAVRPWAGLSAPEGIFFAGGNHDDFGDRSRYLAALGRVGLRVLNNEKVAVDGLQIAGVHDAEAGDPGRFREILGGMNLDRSVASILLAHRPSHLEIPEAAGVSLQLSGHTHSGQFWPWSLLVSRIYGPFAYGLNRLGGLLVYTSSGVGTWGPPMRVGTRSEMVVMRLE
jgi:predicted MPP superfamily phosphohydrolase